jgi:hypothetical protein
MGSLSDSTNVWLMTFLAGFTRLGVGRADFRSGEFSALAKGCLVVFVAAVLDIGAFVVDLLARVVEEDVGGCTDLLRLDALAGTPVRLAIAPSKERR